MGLMNDMQPGTTDDGAVERRDGENSGGTLLDALVWLCSHYEKPMTGKSLLAGLPVHGDLTPETAVRALTQAGFTSGLLEKPVQDIFSYLFPAILILKDGGACVLIDRISDEGSGTMHYKAVDLAQEPTELLVTQHQLTDQYSGFCILAKPGYKHDTRAGEPVPPAAGSWLWGTLWRYRGYYTSAILAALLINVLTLASTFFTMNVYDRVVPTQAYVTLWSLAAGVLVAMLFEFTARHLRGYLIDIAGKKADLVIGTDLFRQALSVRLEFRPASSGSFSHQLREFESVRDFATSATLATLTDFPFVLLFIGVIFMIAGQLALVPILAIPVVMGIGLLIQWPLSKAMREHLRESSLKQGVMIESLDGIETLKAAGAEGFMQKRLEDCSALTAQTSMKSRMLSSLAMNLVTSIQQLDTVIIVVWGVYLIHAGQLTMGGLVGAVMLASRAIAPLGQVVNLAVRYQQARAAMESLNKLMKMPTERDERRDYLSRPTLQGALRMDDVSFGYPVQGNRPRAEVLHGIRLKIGAGERVAVLGRIGSGKSTLLRILAGLYQPLQGGVLADDVDIRQIDPADWRAAVGYVGQEVRLFHGTLRENIMLACPNADTDAFLQVARMSGLDRIAASHPLGFDMPVGEMGRGLSGGQQQLVALARCLLAKPKILMLDEPTSAMDLQTEAAFIQQMAATLGNCTFILVTHRPSLLCLVNRIVVIDNGRIVADGPRDQIIAALQANSSDAARASA